MLAATLACSPAYAAVSPVIEDEWYLHSVLRANLDSIGVYLHTQIANKEKGRKPKPSPLDLLIRATGQLLVVAFRRQL